MMSITNTKIPFPTKAIVTSIANGLIAKVIKTAWETLFPPLDGKLTIDNYGPKIGREFRYQARLKYDTHFPLQVRAVIYFFLGYPFGLVTAAVTLFCFHPFKEVPFSKKFVICTAIPYGIDQFSHLWRFLFRSLATRSPSQIKGIIERCSVVAKPATIVLKDGREVVINQHPPGGDPELDQLHSLTCNLGIFHLVHIWSLMSRG